MVHDELPLLRDRRLAGALRLEALAAPIERDGGGRAGHDRLGRDHGPVMVASGHWVWDTKGAYFGILLQNYWGWWLTIFTTFALYLLISDKPVKLAEVRFDVLALAGYLTTALGIELISLVTSVGNLAFIGFFAMMPWVIAEWLKMA